MINPINAVTKYIINSNIIADILDNTARDDVWDIYAVESAITEQIDYDRSAIHDENSVEFIRGLDAFGKMEIQCEVLLPLFQRNEQID
jgi:hypothetical protein